VYGCTPAGERQSQVYIKDEGGALGCRQCGKYICSFGGQHNWDHLNKELAGGYTLPPLQLKNLKKGLDEDAPILL